jgi:hypothetical protein
MRWQEQVTITTYEMQWTVRYFLYVSQKWVIPPGTGGSENTGIGGNTGNSGNTGIGCVPGNSALGTSSDVSTSNYPVAGNITSPTLVLTSGAIAYRKRKKALWEDFMLKADGIFKRSNSAYQSPL